ncbi:MAG: type II toxin-antitoxin system Phd/YefM family antitoxin [Methylococcaceae bacterium]|nr:MAG: type II toxin-antitoxin system Phd/YefM family antitoxin [Methylococcaceae bacterium]
MVVGEQICPVCATIRLRESACPRRIKNLYSDLNSDPFRALVMSTLHISEDILPLGQFKIQASALLKSINSSNRSIVITQNGKPAAVVMSPSEFDRITTQARFISAVQQGLNDVQAGRVIDDETLDEVLEGKIAKL